MTNNTFCVNGLILTPSKKNSTDGKILINILLSLLAFFATTYLNTSIKLEFIVYHFFL